MPDFVTNVYLLFMFLALYFFFLFILIVIRNRHRIFDYPEPNNVYSVSVLIAGYNEEKTIKDTVEHVVNADYKLKEIIVINDGSSDKTELIVKELQKKYKNLKLINNKENLGKAESLNKGIKISKGELIAVIDADSYPEKESIRKLVGYFNDEKMGAVTSAVFIRNKNNFLLRLQQVEYIILAWNRKLLNFIGAVYVTNGPLSMYRRTGLVEVGGFDKKTVTEDIDVTWNLMAHGYNTAMCLSAFVTTTCPSKFSKWWRQRERWGIGGFQAIYKYRKYFLRKGILGFFVIPFVSLSILLSIFGFIFGFYLIARKFILTYLSAKYSFLTNTYLFNLQNINLYPSILIFFIIVLFCTAFVYTRYILIILGRKKGEWGEVSNLFNRLFYLIVYLTLYPLIWFSSIYRIIRRDYNW